MNETTTALVTGAGGGIGRAICKELASRGNNVVAIDRNEESVNELAEELQAVGKMIRPVALELTDTDALDALVMELGEVKILVNNAGIFDVSPFTELSNNDFRRHFDVNVMAPVDLIRRLITHMRPGSSILNMASVAMNGARNCAHYAVSKAGVVALTRTLAGEFAAQGVRVNAIAPGAIRTPMLMGRSDNGADAILPFIPLGDFGEPEDIADSVGFLTSDQAKYITGHTLVIDGGLTLGG